MERIEYSKYGEPEVLKILEVSEPRINGDNKLLIKVLYSSLNAIDWKNRRGHFRLVSGIIKPRTKQGFDVVGVVVSKSENLSDFEIGEKVVGQFGNLTGGALSEYVILTNEQAVIAPDNVDIRELGAMPMAGTTAWQALFENAKLKPGDKLLINGGSSGVGHLAIQIAKAYGAEVTSVSSNRNLEFCKNIGADYTIDYTKEDFTKLNKKFDIVFDVVFNSSLKKVKPILNPTGVYIVTTPSPRLLYDMLWSKQAKLVSVRPNTKALKDICRLMAEGKVSVHIDKVYGIDEVVEAHKYVEQSRTKGKVIIKINE